MYREEVHDEHEWKFTEDAMENKFVVETKNIECTPPTHVSQVLTHLRFFVSFREPVIIQSGAS